MSTVDKYRRYVTTSFVAGIEHDELLGVIEQLADVVAAATTTDIQMTVIDDRPPTEVAEDHAIVRAMAAAHQDVTGEPVVIGGVPGTTDGTILTRDADIPVVVYGPGGKWIAHQSDEFVEVAQLTTAADVYAEAAWRFLHAGAA